MGLWRYAAKPSCSARASRRPSEVKRTRGSASPAGCSRIARARATPSISGMCMSRMPTSKRSSARIHASASRGDPVARARMPQASEVRR